MFSLYIGIIRTAAVEMCYTADFPHPSPAQRTQRTLNGIYKPTALIVDGIFYLYYTARDNQDSKRNQLFVTSINWEDLLYSIK